MLAGVVRQDVLELVVLELVVVILELVLVALHLALVALERGLELLLEVGLGLGRDVRVLLREAGLLLLGLVLDVRSGHHGSEALCQLGSELELLSAVIAD